MIYEYFHPSDATLSSDLLLPALSRSGRKAVRVRRHFIEAEALLALWKLTYSQHFNVVNVPCLLNIRWCQPFRRKLACPMFIS